MVERTMYGGKKNGSLEDTYLEINKWKGQYVPVLNQVPRHKGERILTPLILNLKNRGR
jgi:hypothetical protein